MWLVGHVVGVRVVGHVVGHVVEVVCILIPKIINKKAASNNDTSP